MAVAELKSFYPEWYKDWLFNSLSLKNGDEISEEILQPLFSLNKNWLQENYNQEEYSWDHPAVARSYALYYMTINLPKLWMVLRNSGVWLKNSLPNIKSVTEFGSGPGTFLWSYLLFLYRQNKEALKELKVIKAVDTSAEHLKNAEKLFKEIRKRPEFSHLKLETINCEWQNSYEEHSSDLNIFGNSLIESAAEEKIISSLGLKNILIIEPGTKEQFSRLRKLKSKFSEYGWSTHFPCPVSGDCPMAEDNWCHFHINRFILPFIQKMSNAAHRKNHRHNFSAFLISKHNNNLNTENWRVLSNNRKVKRTSIRYICNGEKIVEAVLNRKERSDLNRDFINCETGCCCYSSAKFQNSRLKAGDKFSSGSEID